MFKRVPINISLDDRYFTDKFQGIPMQEYTKMCEKMITNDLITLELNTSFKEVKIK
ncbi:hypothetical protein OLQ22_09245 [Campylobacter jejuni]|nr:hypothetical protein [Campylobacter jejuni]